MQIIIETKSPRVQNLLFNLLKLADWIGEVRVWKKEKGRPKEEVSLLPPSESEKPQLEPSPNYREFWGCIQPQIGIETTDKLIAAMRED